MALDRQSIERRDFPVGAHGYDPDAVHAHLARIATEVEELRAASRRRGETLAASASEQVRAILEAAENSAAEIQRRATAEASDYVGRVFTSMQTMLHRVDAMRSELSALLEGLPKLTHDLSDAGAAAQPQLAFGREPEPAPSGELRPQSAPSDEPRPEAVAAGPQVVAPEPEAWAPTSVTAEPEAIGDDLAGGFRATGSAGAAGPPNIGDDTEGARLIALNMAQNGTSREEADRYLAENFSLSDRASLLDEVYSSVES